MNKLSPKLSTEKISITFDFSNDIGVTDFIVSTSWTASVISGVDATPSAILVGPASNSTHIANHIIAGGVSGVIYQIDCTATTNLGLIYVLNGEMEIISSVSSERQKLVDFCLRQLGAPVINIEVAPEQLEDAIDVAFQHYHEYHFDGLVRDYLVHKISGTQITLADVTGFRVGDSIKSIDGLTAATIVSISNNTITTNRQIGWSKFQLNQSVKSSGTGTVTTITAIVLGDVDNGWITCGDNIVGVTKILNVSSILSSSDYMFNMQYQIMNTEMQALTKAGASMYWQTLNYLGHLDFIMKKENNFTFHRRINRLILEVAWGTDIKVNDVVVAEVYRAVDEHEYPEVYKDIWIRRYVTALIKKQWGTNMSKYSGMQLPGGLTFNGLETYNQAVLEIQKLEDEAAFGSAPLGFEIG